MSNPADDTGSISLLLSDLDVWLLAEGTHLRPYEVLGAHPFVLNGVKGTRFAVCATR